MPKTFTNDIAPSLPSSIEGPFTVVDPADATSRLVIDPAGARIAAEGGARPARILTAGGGRGYGSSIAHYIGGYIIARYVNAGSTGGFYFFPIRVPDDMDVSQPSKIRILVNPLHDAATNGQVIRFVLYAARVAADGTISSTSVTRDWNVPDNWTTDHCSFVLGLLHFALSRLDIRGRNRAGLRRLRAPGQKSNGETSDDHQHM